MDEGGVCVAGEVRRKKKPASLFYNKTGNKLQKLPSFPRIYESGPSPTLLLLTWFTREVGFSPKPNPKPKPKYITQNPNYTCNTHNTYITSLKNLNTFLIN